MDILTHGYMDILTHGYSDARALGISSMLNRTKGGQLRLAAGMKELLVGKPDSS
jgi:hypothetical protein